MKAFSYILILVILLPLAACTHSEVVQRPAASYGTTAATHADTTAQAPKDEYLAKREAMLKYDESLRFDSDITLNEDERALDAYLDNLRSQMNARYARRYFFPPANSFFKAKADIESSELINILKKMPKGGALHLHSYATGDMHWIVNDALSRDNAYVYWYDDSKEFIEGELGIYEPGKAPVGFSPVKDVAAAVPFFDQLLYGQLTLDDENKKEFDIWVEFEKCFKRLDNYLAYKPVFKEYYKAAFKTFIEDNVWYIELRLTTPPLFDLKGNTYSMKDTVDILWEIRNELRETYPQFDLKLIMSSNRSTAVDAVTNDIESVIELRKAYPDFIIGYDLIGEEDKGNTTLFYLDSWLRLKELEKEYGIDLPLYFHDGETNRTDNTNIYDAYLLGSRRIGHGLNLYNFPNLKREIIKNGVALEVSPISNQVLDYTLDLRTHPAGGYLREGVPMTLSSDGPGFFGYTGLSFDYWEAYMAWDLDLKALKKLAMSSITYSGMNDDEKKAAMEHFHKSWYEFIEWSQEKYVNQ